MGAKNPGMHGLCLWQPCYNCICLKSLWVHNKTVQGYQVSDVDVALSSVGLGMKELSSQNSSSSSSILSSNISLTVSTCVVGVALITLVTPLTWPLLLSYMATVGVAVDWLFTFGRKGFGKFRLAFWRQGVAPWRTFLWGWNLTIYTLGPNKQTRATVALMLTHIHSDVVSVWK